jgi:hypothetical protein
MGQPRDLPQSDGRDRDSRFLLAGCGWLDGPASTVASDRLLSTEGRECWAESLLPSLGSPTFQWSDRSHDISDNLYFAGHVAEDFVGLPSGWDQPDDGFAVLGDQHRLTAVQDLIHNRQAVRFELTGICFTKWCILL